MKKVACLHVIWLLATSSLRISGLPVPSSGYIPETSRDRPTGSTTPAEEERIFMRIVYPDRSSQTLPRIIDPELHKKAPGYIAQGVLNNKNGYLLRINADGTVDGTRDNGSSFAKLEFHSVGTGLLMVMGVATNRYLAISDAGLLHGSTDPSLNCIFEEVQEENYFHSYTSYKFKKNRWLVGLKKNGKAKRATATGFGQKATQFLPIYA